jgi:Ca2+-binding EF-hand superfamily protein
MTTISATTSTSAYSYTKSTSSASSDISSCITVPAQKATTTDQTDDDTSSSAEKLMAQLMALAMSQFASQSGATDSQGSDDTDGGIAAMDSDGDGIVSKAEFVSARPSDVAEDQAGALFDSFDSEGAGSLSVSALSEAMSAQGGPGGPPPAAGDDDDDDDQIASLFSELDANGDGVVTADEFTSAMSSDASESQTSDLFALLDRGTVSKSENDRPPPPPRPADDASIEDAA